MAEKNDRAPAPKSDEVVKRKRFRIERLEERIAPKKGGKGTHNGCGTANCTSFSVSGGGY